MALRAHDEILVRYHGSEERHARIVLAHVDGGEFYIVTPDANVYIEDLSGTSKEVQSWIRRPRDGSLPFGLDGSEVYDFGERPNQAQLDLLVEGAENEARTERMARGLGDARRAPARRGRRSAAQSRRVRLRLGLAAGRRASTRRWFRRTRRQSGRCGPSRPH